MPNHSFAIYKMENNTMINVAAAAKEEAPDLSSLLAHEDTLDIRKPN
jgi:hypothetical protein